MILYIYIDLYSDLIFEIACYNLLPFDGMSPSPLAWLQTGWSDSASGDSQLVTPEVQEEVESELFGNSWFCQNYRVNLNEEFSPHIFYDYMTYDYSMRYFFFFFSKI